MLLVLLDLLVWFNVPAMMVYHKEYYTYFLARARHVEEDLLVAEGQEQVYYGYPNVNQESCTGVELCPQLVLTIVSALGAFGLLNLYLAATQNTNGKRKRRRRSLQGREKSLLEGLGDLIIYGKERNTTCAFRKW